MRFYSFPPPDGLAVLRSWLVAFLVVWALGALGLGWIVNSLFVLLGLAILAPTIAIAGLQWWVRRSLVTAPCPTCAHEFTATRQGTFQCPSCGDRLEVQKQRFVRVAPPGTIDVEVQAVD